MAEGSGLRAALQGGLGGHADVRADDPGLCEPGSGRGGFDTAALAKLSGSHVGLGIMRERALGIRADLSITSQPDTGSQVRLCLPHQERNLA